MSNTLYLVVGKIPYEGTDLEMVTTNEREAISYMNSYSWGDDECEIIRYIKGDDDTKYQWDRSYSKSVMADDRGNEK